MAVFVDGGYLDKVLQDMGFPKVNLERLSEKMASGFGPRLRSYYYHCPPFQSPSPNREESERYRRKTSFFDALSRLDRFEVRLGHLAMRGKDRNGNPILVQKGVDVKLATDLVRLSLREKIEKACLIAGDGDFVPALEVVKDAGVLVHMFYGEGPNCSYSQQLWDTCDSRTLIDSGFVADCLMEGCRTP